MSESNSCRVIPPGMRWPSGDYVEVAILPVDETRIEEAFGEKVTRGSETGLGAWHAIGIELKSGAVVELINYAHEKTRGFTLRVDSGFSPDHVLGEIVQLLDLTRDELPWTSPLVAVSNAPESEGEDGS